MDKPLVLCGRIFTAELIGHLNLELVREPPMGKNALARILCQHLGWFSPDGRPALASAKVALGKLEKRGLLPGSNSGPRPARAHRLRGSDQRLPAVSKVPAQAGKVQDLRLYLLSGHQDPLHGLWNDLMIRQHPCGAAPLVGAQLRYLVGSDHGWLGALGFGPAAFVLGARDHQKLWAFMAAQPVGQTRTIDVPRRRGQRARQATVELRWSSITIEAPKVGCKKGWPPLTLWAVWAHELNAPEGVRLVTSLGGFLGRSKDGEPGAEILGNGLRRLMDMTRGWRLRKQLYEATKS